MPERLVCVQLTRLERQGALLEEKYVGQDGKYTSVPEGEGTVDEMIELARKILAASPKNVSYGEKHAKKLKEYVREQLQGTPEEIKISTFLDKQGNLHEGIPWVITDSEGVDHSMYREGGTGKLFPIEERANVRSGKIKKFGELKPIVIAERLNAENLLCAFLDSPVLRTRIKIGKLNPGEKTATVGKHTVPIDNSQANPGDRVIIYEII